MHGGGASRDNAEYAATARARGTCLRNDAEYHCGETKGPFCKNR